MINIQKPLSINLLSVLLLPLLLNSCFLLRPTDGAETCGIFEAADTLHYAFTFYSSGKVMEFSTHVKEHGWWDRKGYLYNFYPNGRIKEITYFEKGVFNPFVIGFDKDGVLKELISNSGKDMLVMIARNINSPEKIGEVRETWVIDQAPRGNLRVYYNSSTGKVTIIEEYDSQQTGSNPEKGTVTYWIYKSGLQLIMGKRGVLSIRSYQEDKRIGENLVFNRKGKLEKFYYKGGNSLGIAFKTKDLPKVVSAQPCYSE